MSGSWHLITGEYPPQPGGVADYTSLLAPALAERVGLVHVWCPGDEPASQSDGQSVVVHRVAGRLGVRGLLRLDRELDRVPGPRRLLIEYTPHAYGWKALNVPFVVWVASRRVRGDVVRILFHEVAYPWVRSPLRHNLLALVHRLMAAILLQSAQRVDVTIPRWIPLLQALGGRRVPITWTPVPANVPADPHPRRAEAIRSKYRGPDSDAVLIGHFGTYGASITALLDPVIRTLLSSESRVRVLLLGRGGEAYRESLLRTQPDWSQRVFATGGLPAVDLAAHLQACELVVQPFPDGISTRRGSSMAALANGVAVVANPGPATEPIWAEHQAVALAEPADLAVTLLGLLNEPQVRTELALRGQTLYQDRFAIRHTVTTLLDTPHA